MNEELDLWRLAAGLGLFLFGMHGLEQALTQLAGRSFKKFLRDYTAKYYMRAWSGSTEGDNPPTA